MQMLKSRRVRGFTLCIDSPTVPLESSSTYLRGQSEVRNAPNVARRERDQARPPKHSTRVAVDDRTTPSQGGGHSVDEAAPNFKPQRFNGDSRTCVQATIAAVAAASMQTGENAGDDPTGAMQGERGAG